MGRDALQPGELVGSHPQDVLQHRVDQGPISRNQRGQLLIQQTALAQHPGRQLMGKPPVTAGEAAGNAVESRVERFSLAHLG
jgi:hypothetical protein